MSTHGTGLPDDVARCAGVGSDAEGWREGCETCLRRLSPAGRFHMQPPAIIAFECEYFIESNASGETLVGIAIHRG